MSKKVDPKKTINQKEPLKRIPTLKDTKNKVELPVEPPIEPIKPNYSEFISKEIIIKIIGLAIRLHHENEVKSQIPNYCCEFVFDCLKPCLLGEFMAYDQCEDENNENPLFFNNRFIDNNTWKEIIEPVTIFD